jgi:hypothetical protein
MPDEKRPRRKPRQTKNATEARERPKRGVMTDDERIDEASKESFPASDPPANSPRPAPKKKKK